MSGGGINFWPPLFTALFQNWATPIKKWPPLFTALYHKFPYVNMTRSSLKFLKNLLFSFENLKNFLPSGRLASNFSSECSIEACNMQNVTIPPQI